MRGKAIGGHFELVSHCDLIVAADTATFHAIESQTGMIPLAGGLQRFADRIGRGRAAELATRVVADDKVDAEAIALAERPATGPMLAFGAARALLKSWSSGGVAGADEVHLDLSMRLFKTSDAQQAFCHAEESA